MTLLYIILFYIVTTFFAGIAIYVCKNYRNKPHFIECVIIGLLSVVLPICLFFYVRCRVYMYGDGSHTEFRKGLV